MKEAIKNFSANKFDITAWILIAVVLLFIVNLHLVPALLAGFLVFEVVLAFAKLFMGRYMSSLGARIIAVTIITSLVIAFFALLAWGLLKILPGDPESIQALFKKMAEILASSQGTLPQWLVEHFPKDAEEMKLSIITWLNKHSSALPVAGYDAARIFAHIIIGIVLGAIISLRGTFNIDEMKPLSRSLLLRTRHFRAAFRDVVFSQVRISALNTLFTWIYLFVILPLFGVHLPLSKTMVAITFITGLLPVVGNLISNSVIVVVSLSSSLAVAIASLVFLILIHKLEYFLNANIIGSRINARAWELLIAMLFMEAAFGLSGVIAAPIYYAYLKNELREQELI